MESKNLKALAKAICISAVFFSIPAKAEFQLRDITDAVGQVKKILPSSNSSRNSASYIPPGMGITLDNGQRAKAYGYDCQPNEKQLCGSIKVTAGSHKVMIVPVSGKSFDERWTFKRLDGNSMVAVRPDGTILEAKID
ncbi:hypothetical protein [Pseudomonas sp. TMW 2.1634]|uniref:hypothetical protein n=1 Tax=Pseudomonas sp. TMW 2.1634 TaxID=1886807 RepID=UPI0013C4D837|nr:hypothetical protein [Pseudomonas sp. TMW 2.1634]